MKLEQLLTEIHESDSVFLQRMKELFLAQTHGLLAPRKGELAHALFMRFITEGDPKTKLNAINKAKSFISVLSEYAKKHEPALETEINKYADKRDEYVRESLKQAEERIKKDGRVAGTSNVYSGNPEPRRTSKHAVKNAAVNELPVQDYKKRVEI